MPQSRNLISVVIPVKNGAETLSVCLDGIGMQKVNADLEVIVIDSGSTDPSLEIIRKYPKTKIISIDPASFNHGLTRNLGVAHANGDFIVMTVQDAVPADEQWLAKMLRHFNDPNVAGVCGQQVVPHHKDKNPHQWFRPVSPPGIKKVRFNSPEEYEMLIPAEKKQACSWDDVNAMYRREALLKIPFREAFFAEDAMWAQDALRAGYTLVYDTSARVYHYHYQSYNYTYRRILTQLYFTYKIFGLKRKLIAKKSEYLKIVYRNLKYKAHPKWIWHNFQILRARERAFRDFYDCLEQSDDLLDIMYKKVCQVPPQGSASQ